MEQTASRISLSGSQIPTSPSPLGNEAHSSGVCWSAVIAGGFVTAAVSLILLALGTGLGLSSFSVWSYSSSTATKLGAAAILWMICTHLASSAMGGYLAGRLRTKWSNIHNDEVYFRDTAHGFLAWSVAVVITAAFLASAAASMIGSSSAEGGIKSPPRFQSESQTTSANMYFIDMLFRSDHPAIDSASSNDWSEAAVIFAESLKKGDLAPDDKGYVDQLVSIRTGMNQTEADKRVLDTFNKAKEAVESTRKTLAHTLLWAFLALLIGAFCASFAATIGGRQRDHVVVI